MKKKTAVIAAIIGGGCIVFSFLQVILIGGIMGGSAYLLNSCSRDMNEKIEQSEKILNRFTESGLPEVLELPDKTVIDQKFATEYMPCESAYDTIILRNYEIIPRLYNSPKDKIAVTADGKILTEDYFERIEYNYKGFKPRGEEEYLACYNYHDDSVLFITPEGKEICTEAKENLPESSVENDFPQQKYTIKNPENCGKKGVADESGNTVLPCQYDSISYLDGDCFFLRKDGESSFFSADSSTFVSTDSAIEDFSKLNGFYYARSVTSDERKVYTIYQCKGE
ncbi:MAG: WG repeat-containing protein [Ruminococcus sp.]|nr:WG repeat-containing protein [Ruminococcus sp.]